MESSIYKNKLMIKIKTNDIEKDIYIDAKIDTGATELFIPFKYLKNFIPTKDASKTENIIKQNKYNIKPFEVANGNKFNGYMQRIKVRVKGVDKDLIIKACFYDRDVSYALLGLKPLLKHFKLCIEKDKFTLETI